jgi:hypothetical protein
MFQCGNACTSVADPEPPDPRDFGPPESGSGSISQRYHMDPDPSIIKQKIVRKTLISTFCDFFLTFIFQKGCKCTFKK